MLINNDNSCSISENLPSSSNPRRNTSSNYGAIEMNGQKAVDRPPLNQVQFDQEYGGIHEEKKTLRTKLRKSVVQWLYPFTGITPFFTTLFGFLPILTWLPNYDIKENLLCDIVGGLTTGIMHVPQGIAYSLLAGVDPVNGLYASCFPAFFYMFFGTSRHVSIGSFAVVALMAGIANDNVQASLSPPHLIKGSNGTEDHLEVITPIHIAATLTFALGIIQFSCGFLRLQFLTAYFSDQLVSGFTTGAAVHVLMAQIDDVMGIKVPKVSGPGYLFTRAYDIAIRVSQMNYAAFVTSIISITFLCLGKDVLNPILKKKFSLKIPIPYELILVAVSAGFSYMMGLHEKYDVPIVDDIPTGMPSPQWPVFSILPQCLLNTIGISIVTIAIHISMSKMLAKKMNYEIDPQQELYALGLTSMYGGLFPVYPVSTALGRTMVNVSSGSKTLLSTVFSCLLLFTIILWLGPLLKTLPMCILASIILVALKSMFEKGEELKKLYPVSKIDFLIWMVAFLSTVCIDVMEGLTISIGFALFTLICRSQWPKWHNLIRVAEESTVKGESEDNVDICVYRFDAPLMFANVERFRKTIKKSLEEWNEKSEKTTRVQTSISPCPSINRSIDDSLENSIDLHLQGKHKRPRFFIIDLSPVPYADFMGLAALKEIAQEIQGDGVCVYICGAENDVRSSMKKADVFKVVTMENIFPTLKDALSIAYRNGKASEMLCSAKKAQVKREKSCTLSEKEIRSIDEQ